ncbi:MAG: acyltransferase family protein [Acidobacteria bacterium]|nr:acyltransferase family protein [Acidobacteriota bacterium]
MIRPNIRGYREDIDGLRALAVLPVVLFHLGAPAFSGGFVGVDIFFVISGFLITGIVWREIEQSRFSLVNFYERRARRILPALFAVIACCFLVALSLFTPEEMETFAESAVGAVLFIENIVLYFQSGYFDAAAETKPLLHLWSLAVEEQFYIFLPIALMLLARYLNRRQVVTLLALACVGSLALSSFLTHRSPAFNFYMSPLRAWELLLGSLLAVADLPKARRGPAAHAISLAGLLAILISVFAYSAETPFPGYTALPPALGAAAILWAGREGYAGRMLSWGPLVFIGMISYSLYMWHWPLIVFFRLVVLRSVEFQDQVLLFVVSIGLAVLSWRFIEQPFREKTAVWKSRRAVFASSLAGIVLLSAASAVPLLSDGLPSRLTPEALSLAGVSYEKEVSDRQCQPDIVLAKLRGRDRGLCQLGAEAASDDQPKVLVWGDSHVGAWYPLLDRAFKASGVSALGISTAGCPIAFGLERAEVDKDGCLEMTTVVRDYIARAKIERVLVVGSWFGALTTKNTVFDGLESVDDATRLRNIVGAISLTGNTLEEMGVASGFLVTAPGAKYSVPEALFRQHRVKTDFEIRRSHAEYLEAMSPLIDAAEANFDHVLRIDREVCSEGYCAVRADGRPLYFDSNHPSLYMNEYAYGFLAPQINEFLTSGPPEERMLGQSEDRL